MDGNHHDEVTLMDYLEVFIRQWRIVVIYLVMVMIATLVATRMMPREYRARASVFVEMRTGGASAIMMLGQLSSLGMAGTSGTQLDYMKSLLDSDSMGYRVLEKLDLVHNPKFVPQGVKFAKDQLLGRLKRLVTIDVNRRSLVTVTVESRDPELSAKIANTYVSLLGDMVITRGKIKREFIERQLKETTDSLKASEEKLREFQEKNGLVDLDIQVQSVVENMVTLQRELATNEISLHEIEELRGSTASISDLISLDERSKTIRVRNSELRKQLAQMERQIASLPSSGLQYARLTREVKVDQKIFEILTEQFELARIAETDDSLPFQIVDRATPPSAPFKPQMMINLPIGLILGLFLGGGAAFLTEAMAAWKRRRA